MKVLWCCTCSSLKALSRALVSVTLRGKERRGPLYDSGTTICSCFNCLTSSVKGSTTESRRWEIKSGGNRTWPYGKYKKKNHIKQVSHTTYLVRIGVTAKQSIFWYLDSGKCYGKCIISGISLLDRFSDKIIPANHLKLSRKGKMPLKIMKNQEEIVIVGYRTRINTLSRIKS